GPAQGFRRPAAAGLLLRADPGGAGRGRGLGLRVNARASPWGERPFSSVFLDKSRGCGYNQNSENILNRYRFPPRGSGAERAVSSLNHDYILQLEDIHKRFGDTQVLNGIDLQVR